MVRNIGGLFSSVARRNRRGDEEEVEIATEETCLFCDTNLSDSELYARYRICNDCRFHYSMTARERIDSLVDSGTFKEINRSLISLDPLSFSSRVSYKQRIFHDQRRTGLTEAIVTGTCTIGGSQAMLVVLDFGFLGGTMGCVVGEKVSLAFEHALKRKLPTIAVVTSGGSRIQEGVLSLMQMAKTTIATRQSNDKGLPFISVLANPATGQAYASFANLADLIIGEPGAIVGFTPLRVIQESTDEPLPSDSHTAESHFEHGMIDAVVDRASLRDLLAIILDLLGPQYQLIPREKRQRQPVEAPRPDAWNSVQLARHASRPTSSDYISRILTNFVEIHGDRTFGDDNAIVCGIGQIGGQTVVAIGQERRKASNEGRVSPEGFRKAQRALKMAAKFDIPLLTLIDTPGPLVSMEAEERGLGSAIATTMSLMSGLEVPSISVVIGEGGNAAALALGVADRVLMLENAIYSTISPEDAAELIYQDEARADEAAESLRLTSRDCRELGIVDLVVPEPPGGAHTNPDESARQLRRILVEELAELQAMSKSRMIKNRYKKFRNIGQYSSRFKASINREVNALQGFANRRFHRIRRRSDGESSEAIVGVPPSETPASQEEDS